MDASIVRVTLSLIGPGILLIFGLAFFATWRIDRHRTYLAMFAAGCWLFTLGASVQIVYWPPDTGLNSMISGTLYAAAVLTTVQGLLQRGGKPVIWESLALILIVFVLANWYFFYVDRSLLARVYIQNFGYGALLLGTALRLLHLRKARLVDQVLFWVLLIFALQFFPRTLLTIGFAAPVGAQAVANSVFWQSLQLSLAVLGTALALSMLAACASDVIEDLRRERDTDGLSGMLNRRAFEERVRGELQRRTNPGVLIVCDVDHFKAINDTWGHQAGDDVLRIVAAILRAPIRHPGLSGRLGGEEFGVFLPGANLVDALAVATRLRRAIASHDFLLDGAPTRITASFGVADALVGDDWEALYRHADRLLYESKRGGRNRVSSIMVEARSPS